MADYDLLPTGQKVIGSSHKGAGIHIPITAALTTAMLALNKTVRLCQIPKGFVLTGISGTIPILDSNGSPLLTWGLGDTGSAARLISASTKGRTSVATLATSDLVVAGYQYEYTAKTDLLWTTSAAAATAVAGTVKLTLSGYIK